MFVSRSQSRVVIALLLLSVAVVPVSQAWCETVTFDDLSLPAGSDFYNGNTGVNNSDGWSADGVFFNNNYNVPAGGFGEYWSGWSYSAVVDPDTPNFINQYASAPGGGSDGAGQAVGGEIYALAYFDGFSSTYFNIPDGFVIGAMDWTNTTYAYLSMLNGDAANGSQFPAGKQFGGADGTDPDFFRAILTGYSDPNAVGSVTGTVVLDLADFTFADSNDDFLINEWKVDENLTALGTARSVGLTFESSDVGPFGVNTPTYLAIDNLQLTAVPEPSGAIVLMMAAMVTAVRRRR